jgi:hypothetical protein
MAMSLFDDLRTDIGDDSALASGVIANPSSLIDDIKIDIGDDGLTGNSTVGPTFASPVTIQTSGICQPIIDLRVDIADDSNINYVSSSGIPQLPEQGVGLDLYKLLVDFRVDIGDDEEVEFGRIIDVIPTIPECPEVWCSVVVTDNAYATERENVFVLVSPTIAGPTTITLHSDAYVGQIIVIKDLKGDAFTNNITINATPNLIDGLSGFLLTQNKQSIQLMWSGSEWSIF